MTYPRVYLAIDNCFAAKRWPTPHEWMYVTESIGIRYVEASADTELNPLQVTPDYLEDWIGQVRDAEQSTGCSVCNLYSGVGTYRTTGLGHPDERVRRVLMEKFLKPMIDTAGRLEAGLGFYCHAVPDSVLQNAAYYRAWRSQVIEGLSEAADYAAGRIGKELSLEQMYSPHQPPWTIADTREMLAAVREAGSDLYVTVDVGHQIGQIHYRRPDRDSLLDAIEEGRARNAVPPLWVGPVDAQALLREAVLHPSLQAEGIALQIEEQMDLHPHLFADARDADTHAWLRTVGRWSPIVHLQQHDGAHSSHSPFTARNNESGVVEPAEVLRSLYEAWQQDPEPSLPSPPEELYLTLEVFPPTAQNNQTVLADLAETVRHFRQWLPEDGAPLDEIVAAL